MELEDFLPTYPDYEKDPLFSVYGDEQLTSVIQRKKEFRELALEETEPFPEKPGDLLRHQLFLQRFMSGYTPYDGILLWHSVGTGKTGSAIAIAEGLKKNFTRTLILVRSNTFIQNFKKEIVYVMTSGQYIPEENPNRPLTEMERTRRTNRLLETYYEFNTFQVFAKMFEQSTNKQKLLDYYSNSLIIIDEVHNIKEDGGTYSQIHEFLHKIKDTKVVLLTATPIKDKVEEFADVMNLILPIDKQLRVGHDFLRTYFGSIESDLSKLLANPPQIQNETELIEQLKGRISYLQPIRSDVTVVEEGILDPEVAPFPIVSTIMDSVQQASYKEAEKLDKTSSKKPEQKEAEKPEQKEAEQSGLYSKSRSAVLCDTTKEIQSFLKKGSQEEKLSRLHTISNKYHYILNHLLLNQTHNSFIYCRDVAGAGIETLAKILDAFGYSKANPDSLSTEALRYAVITGETQPGYTERIIDAFNREVNKNGKFIQVLIGSAAIGEGRSFKSIRDIFIVTPWWNFTDMDQAIGRGIRYGSHRFFSTKADKKVSIHRLVTRDTVDQRMVNIAYAKDILSKQLEAVVRTAAIDCNLFKVRNRIDVDTEDSSRDCLYQDCDYKCAVPMLENEFEDTYNLFYTEKEYQEIKRELQKQFSLEFQYRIDELLAVPDIRKFSDIVILRSITSMIQRNETFHNPLGFINYLKEKDGILFLIHDYTLPADMSQQYDTKLGQTYPVTSFENYSKDYQITNLKALLNRITTFIESGQKPFAETLFVRLSEGVQNELLKYTLYQRYVNEDTTNKLYKFIDDQLSTTYIQDEDEILLDNEVLDLTTGIWSISEKKEKDLVERLQDMKKGNNPGKVKDFDYYAIYDKDDATILKLSTLGDIPKPSNTGTNVGTGTLNKNGLQKIFDSIMKILGRKDPKPDGAKQYKIEFKKLFAELGLLVENKENVAIKKKYIGSELV